MCSMFLVHACKHIMLLFFICCMVFTYSLGNELKESGLLGKSEFKGENFKKPTNGDLKLLQTNGTKSLNSDKMDLLDANLTKLTSAITRKLLFQDWMETQEANMTKLQDADTAKVLGFQNTSPITVNLPKLLSPTARNFLYQKRQITSDSTNALLDDTREANITTYVDGQVLDSDSMNPPPPNMVKKVDADTRETIDSDNINLPGTIMVKNVDSDIGESLDSYSMNLPNANMVKNVNVDTEETLDNDRINVPDTVMVKDGDSDIGKILNSYGMNRLDENVTKSHSPILRKLFSGFMKELLKADMEKLADSDNVKIPDADNKNRVTADVKKHMNADNPEILASDSMNRVVANLRNPVVRDMNLLAVNLTKYPSKNFTKLFYEDTIKLGEAKMTEPQDAFLIVPLEDMQPLNINQTIYLQSDTGKFPSKKMTSRVERSPRVQQEIKHGTRPKCKALYQRCRFNFECCSSFCYEKSGDTRLRFCRKRK